MSEHALPEGEGWGSVGTADETPVLPELESIPAERWRRFEAPAVIEDSMTDIVIEDGQASRAADVTWGDGAMKKIKQGYQCLKCWEPQPEPFPVECGNPLCRYPMRALQADDFEKEFEGEKWVGPRTSLEDELATLEEKSARRTHRPGSSIAIPGSVNRSRGGVILPPGVHAS